MSEPINPEHLAPTLAALRAWWAEELLSSGQDLPAGATLEAACNRLFAAPESAAKLGTGCGVLACHEPTTGAAQLHSHFSEQDVLVRLCREHGKIVAPEPAPEPTHCAMPRCGKAFIPPEPWYFERGDGVLLPLCHGCHYVVQQPR